MKRTIRTTLSTLALVGTGLWGCADGSDPDTIQRDELSPPLNLLTVTGDQRVELRWNAQNFEDELQGYHVYMIEGSSIADIAAGDAVPKFPSNTYDAAELREASVPRCEENNSFFELFGITKGSDESCEGGLFAQSAEAAADEEAEAGTPQTAKVDCYDPAAPDSLLSTASISLPADSNADYRDGEGVQRCLVKGLTNGTNYTFMVVAVLGSDFDEISWTSNLTDDTPASEKLNQDLTFAEQQIIRIKIDPANELAVTAPSPVACSLAPATENGCTLINANKVVGSEYEIFLARSLSGDHGQRLLISTSDSASSKIRMIGRGPMTLDPLLGPEVIAARIPSDSAVGVQANYYAPGTVVAIYENQVYDFVVENGAGALNFGKIILGNFNYGSATAKNTDLTVNVRIVVQTTTGNTNYLTGFGFL